MSSDLIPTPHQAPHVQQNNCTSPDNMAAATALHHGHQHAGYPSATSDHPHLLGHHVPHVGPHQGAGAAYTNSTSPHSPPATSVAAPPPPPTSNCSSSSVAELQRLSDSMGPAPPPPPPPVGVDRGDHQVPTHPHYTSQRRHQQQQPYPPHSRMGHLDPSGLHSHRTSPPGVEDRLQHSHHGDSPPQQQQDAKPTHKSFKAELSAAASATEAPSPGDYFSGRGQQLPAAAAAASSAVVPTVEDEVSLEYESATCSIHCFYKKEKESQILEDHFKRAIQELDEAGSASPNSEKSKGCVPMSKRQFPASFWNSRSYPPHHQHHSGGQATSHDASSSSAASSLSSLATMHANHAALTAAAAAGDIYHDPYNFLYNSTAATAAAGSADSWHGSWPAYAAHHHHRSAAATSAAMQDVYPRLNPQQYSSLFQLQSMRQAAQGAAAAGRSAIDSYGPATSHHSPYMTGLEGSMQTPSKELYSWF